MTTREFFIIVALGLIVLMVFDMALYKSVPDKFSRRYQWRFLPLSGFILAALYFWRSRGDAR